MNFCNVFFRLTSLICRKSFTPNVTAHPWTGESSSSDPSYATFVRTANATGFDWNVKSDSSLVTDLHHYFLDTSIKVVSRSYMFSLPLKVLCAFQWNSFSIKKGYTTLNWCMHGMWRGRGVEGSWWLPILSYKRDPLNNIHNLDSVVTAHNITSCIITWYTA